MVIVSKQKTSEKVCQNLDFGSPEAWMNFIFKRQKSCKRSIYGAIFLLEKKISRLGMYVFIFHLQIVSSLKLDEEKKNTERGLFL